MRGGVISAGSFAACGGLAVWFALTGSPGLAALNAFSSLLNLGVLLAVRD
jgi:hypothetical protein